jgi:pimeloyl-ACP methyl ester carboxylesterase
MKSMSLELPGTLVTLPARGLKRPLDGFWVTGRSRSRTLLLFVHGMGGNFYRSVSKKEMLLQAPRAGVDVLSFNNRGNEKDVATEIFTDCVHDLDAAVAFGLQHGYRQIVLLGHSTGCQKITYYQARRRHPRVAALVLAAIGDDYAIARRDLGRRYDAQLARARALIKAGRGETIMTAKGCLHFAAHRFLSVADPRQPEAEIFNLAGPLRTFRKITCPTLAVLPAQEEFACLPVAEMSARLRAAARARPFDTVLIPDADHGFKGREIETTGVILDWLKSVLKKVPTMGK